MMIFLVFDESVTDQRTDRPTERPTDRPTDGRTDGRTDRPGYRVARTHLKNVPREVKFVMGPENHAVRLRFLIEPKPFRPNFVK